MPGHFTINLDEGDDMFVTLGIEPEQLASSAAILGSHVVCELNVRASEMNRMFYMKVGSTGVESLANGNYNDALCFTEPAFAPLSSIRVSKALTVYGTGAAQPQFQSAEDKSLGAEMLRRYASELLGNHQLVNLFSNEDDLYNEIRVQDISFNDKIVDKLEEPANGGRNIATNEIIWKPLDIGAANPSPGFFIARILEQTANSSLKTRLELYDTNSSIFREKNIIPTTDASYVDLSGNDASGSHFLVNLEETYSAYLVKQSNAISTLNSYTTAYDNANAAHTIALNTYNELLLEDASGGLPVTNEQHTTYTTAKNNLTKALSNKRAATENKNHFDAMVDKLEQAIIDSEIVDIDKSIVDLSNNYISTTYQLELFKVHDTLSFNVNFYRNGQTPSSTTDPDPVGTASNLPGNGFNDPLENYHTFTIRLNMVEGDPISLNDSDMAQETNVDLYGVETA